MHLEGSVHPNVEALCRQPTGSGQPGGAERGQVSFRPGPTVCSRITPSCERRRRPELFPPAAAATAAAVRPASAERRPTEERLEASRRVRARVKHGKSWRGGRPARWRGCTRWSSSSRCSRSPG